MKKAAIVGLMLVYLFSAIGVTVTSSYCCGSLESTSLSIGENYGGHPRSLPDANNCCKTTKQTFKVKDQHLASGTLFHFVKSAPFVSSSITERNDCVAEVEECPVFNSHAPPKWQSTPIYTWNCTYRV